MCHGYGFYGFPGGHWFMGGMAIFRPLFAIGVLALGYKLIRGLIESKNPSN